MAVGNASGPGGVTLEFYRAFWVVIRDDFLVLLNQAIASGRLLPGVTKGAISLLHKGGERGFLTNWRPITLLNVGYKLFAKALQLRLQLVLMELINFDQAAFLPMRYILDNILLTHEVIDWASHSDQPLVFLKQDFSKAYNMVDWDFLFNAMLVMGFPRQFVDMTRLLFTDAVASVKVNGALSEEFSIRRGVR